MATIDEMISGVKPVLIMFYTPGCSRCEAMAPVVEKLRKETEGRAEIYQVDLSADPELKKRFRIPTCPGWVLFKDGQEVWVDGGEKPYSELKDMIDRFI